MNNQIITTYFCPICERKVPNFIPLGGQLVQEYAKHPPAPITPPEDSHGEDTATAGKPKKRFEMELFAPKTFSCPFCGAMDRERLVAAYLLRRLGRSFRKKNFRLLEFAPRPSIEYFLRTHFTLHHETADMYMKNVMYQINIANMPEIHSSTYDAWICLHVLEHVASDHKALKELLRILKPGGFGILLVPISLSLSTTDEDPDASITDRWARFGQDDHVRLYAKTDFMNRIRAAGFVLEALGKEFFGSIQLKLMGLPDTSVLYIASRPL